MSALLNRAQTALQALPLERLTHPIFQREPGKYYTLINYPPLKAMDERQDTRFPFIAPSANIKRLYLHIPFCSGHCTMCNYRIVVGESDHGPYLRYLVRELDLLVERFGELEISTILLGGGTPSLLSAKELEYLYTSVFSRVKLQGPPYSLFELHPEMVNDADCEAKLKLLRDLGINRVNIGVQAFDDDVLCLINRRHTVRDSLRLIELCAKYGFQYTNYDLIFGLPGQTLDSWERTIEQTLALGPTSISPFWCWMKPAMPIFQRYLRKREDFPTRDEWLQMALMYMGAFEGAGYRFGTVDFYFRPPPEVDQAVPLDIKQYLHTDLDVLALGISGYGFINDTRYMNEVDLRAYYAAIDDGALSISRSYALPQDDLVRLNLMYSLRYDNLNAANLGEFTRRYGVDPLASFAPIWTKLAEMGLIERKDGGLRLTTAGRIYSDEMCMCFVSDAVKERMRHPQLGDHPKMTETYSYMYDLTDIPDLSDL